MTRSTSTGGRLVVASISLPVISGGSIAQGVHQSHDYLTSPQAATWYTVSYIMADCMSTPEHHPSPSLQGHSLLTLQSLCMNLQLISLVSHLDRLVETIQLIVYRL